MSILKYVDRLKRMDDLITRKATGSPEEFARKLGICKSMLMLNLTEFKELGARVKYDAQIQSYCYEEDCHFELKFSYNEKSMINLKGGQNTFENFLYSNNIRMGFCNFLPQ